MNFWLISNHTDGEVDAQVTVRRCITNSEKFEDGNVCMTDTEADPDAHKLDIYPGESMGDLQKFKGKICICKEDKCNGAGQLRITVFLVTLLLVVTAMFSR